MMCQRNFSDNKEAPQALSNEQLNYVHIENYFSQPNVPDPTSSNSLLKENSKDTENEAMPNNVIFG